MKIAIDVSQTAYANTGVANYLENLVVNLVDNNKHEFVLFYSSFRKKTPKWVLDLKTNKNVRIVRKNIPPSGLHLLWNVLHKIPIEKFVGDVDFVITSDWTEPPSKAVKGTILYDLIIFQNPEEMSQKIVSVQKRKLSWVRKESSIVFCISNSTRKDAAKLLNIEDQKLKVLYPGITL